MKFLVVVGVCLVASCVSAGSYGNSNINYNSNILLQSNDGSSSQFRSEDNYGNYAFGYDESHASGGSSRREEESNGVRRGSYSLHDADGRRRLVTYVADASGFHATVVTNEPGMEPKNPANVIVNTVGHQATGYHAQAQQPILRPVASYPVAVPVHHSYTATKSLPAPLPVQLHNYPVITPAQAPAHAPVPVAYVSGPSVAHSGYLAAPRQAEAVAYGPAIVEAPTPRAFSYNFGTSHLAPVAAYRQAHYQVVAPRVVSQSIGYGQQQQVASY